MNPSSEAKMTVESDELEKFEPIQISSQMNIDDYWEVSYLDFTA